MKKSINIAAQQIVFTFDELPTVTLDVTKVSDDVLEHAQYHGLQARIGDNAAIARKQGDTIITVTEAMRRDAVLELVGHYESGTADWSIKGTRAAPQNPTILAIAAKRGCTYVEAEAFLAAQFLEELA